MIDKNIDKRSNKRIQKKNTVGYIFDAENFRLENPIEISMMDLSFNGAGIKLNHPIEQGKIINFDILFNNDEFTVVAEVIWCKKNGDFYLCGIQFKVISDELIAKIETHLKSYNELTYKN